MSTSNLIALITLIATLLGAGAVGTSKLTRIAIGLETLGKGFETLGKLLQEVTGTVSAHETALAILKDHDQAKAAVNGYQPGSQAGPAVEPRP